MSKTKTSLLKQIIFSVLLIVSSTVAYNQCVTTVSSNNGKYSVDIIINLTDIVAPANCPWGYNYNVTLDYDISFSGSNPPASLNTLQANIHCGSDDLFFNIPNSPGTGSLTTTANPWNGNTDCNTATLSSLNCNSITLQINGPGMPNQFILINCTVLPIKLLSFNAKEKNGNIELSWATATEINNDYFTVERSPNGIDWEEINKIKGAGNSNRTLNYFDIDINPLEGLGYYRLKQTDFNGDFEYSKTIVVSTSKQSNIKAYPNPVKEILSITNIDVTNNVKVFASNGQLVYNGNSTTINTSNWSSGLYQLIVLDAAGKQLEKIKIAK